MVSIQKSHSPVVLYPSTRGPSSQPFETLSEIARRTFSSIIPGRESPKFLTTDNMKAELVLEILKSSHDNEEVFETLIRNRPDQIAFYFNLFSSVSKESLSQADYQRTQEIRKLLVRNLSTLIRQDFRAGINIVECLYTFSDLSPLVQIFLETHIQASSELPTLVLKKWAPTPEISENVRKSLHEAEHLPFTIENDVPVFNPQESIDWLNGMTILSPQEISHLMIGLHERGETAAKRGDISEKKYRCLLDKYIFNALKTYLTFQDEHSTSELPARAKAVIESLNRYASTYPFITPYVDRLLREAQEKLFINQLLKSSSPSLPVKKNSFLLPGFVSQSPVNGDAASFLKNLIPPGNGDFNIKLSVLTPHEALALIGSHPVSKSDGQSHEDRLHSTSLKFRDFLKNETTQNLLVEAGIALNKAKVKDADSTRILIEFIRPILLEVEAEAVAHFLCIMEAAYSDHSFGKLWNTMVESVVKVEFVRKENKGRVQEVVRALNSLNQPITGPLQNRLSQFLDVPKKGKISLFNPENALGQAFVEGLYTLEEDYFYKLFAKDGDDSDIIQLVELLRQINEEMNSRTFSNELEKNLFIDQLVAKTQKALFTTDSIQERTHVVLMIQKRQTIIADFRLSAKRKAE